MDDIFYFAKVGFFLGYSPESVVAYIQRRNDVDNRRVTADTPTSAGTELEGTGFIPSARELAMSREEVISDINSRRIHSTPFPEAGDEMDEELDRFFHEDPEEKVRLAWIAFLLNVVHNVKQREEPHESHLCTDPERRQRLTLQTRRTDREAEARSGIPG